MAIKLQANFIKTGYVYRVINNLYSIVSCIRKSSVEGIYYITFSWKFD